VQSGSSEQGPLESHHHMQATAVLLQQAVIQPDHQQTNSRLPLLSADGASLPAAGKHMMDNYVVLPTVVMIVLVPVTGGLRTANTS